MTTQRDLNFNISLIAAAKWIVYMVYMRGWRHGAGGHAIDPNFSGHPEGEITDAYADGYAAGREASKKASKHASLQYAYKPTILRATKEKGA